MNSPLSPAAARLLAELPAQGRCSAQAAAHRAGLPSSAILPASRELLQVGLVTATEMGRNLTILERVGR